MMFTADALIAHAVGDYILQSHWMATAKTRQSFAAAVHALTYALPFLFLTQSPAALAVIIGTHFVIDRWRLARFVVWLKNLQGPRSAWGDWRTTGYPKDAPPFLAVWLLIICDNILHVAINALALKYL